MTDVDCCLAANDRDRFECASRTINSENQNKEHVEANKRDGKVELYNSNITNLKNQFIMKTNNTESESISNNDALNASLFESDSVYGGNNTIQESFCEESEQSVSGFNSSRISYKESEPTHHRESSHPKFAIKASKRIKITCKNKQIGGNIPKQKMYSSQKKFNKIIISSNQNKLNTMFLMLAVPTGYKRSRPPQETMRQSIYFQLPVTTSRLLGQSDSSLNPNSFGIDQWSTAHENNQVFKTKTKKKKKAIEDESEIYEQELMELSTNESASDMEFSGDWISQIDTIKFGVNKLTLEEPAQNPQVMTNQCKMKSIIERTSRSVSKSQNRSFQPNENSQRKASFSGQKSTNLMVNFKTRLLMYKILSKVFEMGLNPTLPGFDDLYEFISLLLSNDWFEESKTTDEFKKISSNSLTSSYQSDQKKYQELIDKNKDLVEMIEMVTNPQPKPRSNSDNEVNEYGCSDQCKCLLNSRLVCTAKMCKRKTMNLTSEVPSVVIKKKKSKGRIGTAKQRAMSVRFSENANRGSKDRHEMKNIINSKLPPKAKRTVNQRLAKKPSNCDSSYISNNETGHPVMLTLTRPMSGVESEYRSRTKPTSFNEPKMYHKIEFTDVWKNANKNKFGNEVELKTFKDILSSIGTRSLVGCGVNPISSQGKMVLNNQSSSSFSLLKEASSNVKYLSKRNSSYKPSSRQNKAKAEQTVKETTKQADDLELKCSKINPTMQMKTRMEQMDVIPHGGRMGKEMNNTYYKIPKGIV